MSNLRILHFVPNDNGAATPALFIDCAIELFKTVSGVESEYYSIDNNPSREFRLLRKNDCVKRVPISRVRSLLLNVDAYDVVFLHTFYSLPSHLIAQIPMGVPVVWSSWGEQLFLLPKMVRSAPLTAHLLKNPPSLSRLIWRRMRNFVLRYVTFTELQKKAVNRIDYCSTVLPEEFDQVAEGCPFFRAKQIFFKYVELDKTVPVLLSEEESSRRSDIIVGNSAWEVNNHLDAFDKMSTLVLHNRKIVVPLSYGNPNNCYRNSILKAGREQFKERFCPLVDFLPIDEYTQIMNSCSHAIYFGLVQYAMGNVFNALALGIKVFLSEKSVQYRHLRSRGFHVFSIESELTQEGIDTPLTYGQAMENHRLMEQHKQPEHYKQNLRCTVDVLREAVAQRKKIGTP